VAKSALITGITGQDGADLAELLLHKSYEVHGTKLVWESRGIEERAVHQSGATLREFLHRHDMADACVFLMNLPDDIYEPIVRSESQAPLFNVGCG
jgi:GDP-D-mannose dehydratase